MLDGLPRRQRLLAMTVGVVIGEACSEGGPGLPQSGLRETTHFSTGSPEEPTARSGASFRLSEHRDYKNHCKTVCRIQSATAGSCEPMVILSAVTVTVGLSNRSILI